MSTTTPVAPAATNGSTAAPRMFLDLTAFLNILNSRVTLKPEHVGQQVILAISGNGQFLPKGFQYMGSGGATENQFDRWIYNVRANSALSMLRAENKATLTEAMKLASVGGNAELDQASELFNDYLNAVQISFSVIQREGRAQRKFERGDMLTAVVAEATNAAGARQIVINDVAYKAPAVVAKTTFSVTDLIG